ncbi:MAG TPA: urate hydroxylase PuuD [Acidimicrobiales bacterium]|jgi:uncharacterized membrane protein|nr:urate hydroxylase PuuD [Acidimicrobiales bacterium]
MALFTRIGGEILSRYAHYLAGVTWIGLLYYFNFVQTPAFVEFEAGPRTEAFRKLVPRALWWFRWGALLTVLSGFFILGFQDNLSGGDYFKSTPGISIATGILFGLIMFSNVWLVIWPNQKIVIANAEAVASGRDPLPNAAAAARKAGCASRTNTVLSIPLLWFMGATAHFAAFKHELIPAGGERLTYWIIVLVLAVLFEGIALSAPAVGKPQAFHIDKHRNTIITGFAVWVVLLLAFEVLFKL